MEPTKQLRFIAYATLLVVLFSCSKDEYRIFDGRYNHSHVRLLKGFPELKPILLKKHNVSQTEFVALTTAKAPDLQEERKEKLKTLRNDLPLPTTETLLQKVIPLSEVYIYMDNVYGGTVGGFVCIAADVKQLRTMYQQYYGLRLDYKDSKFKEDGAGYGVIRFLSNYTSKVIIPYSPEMGGETEGEWPFGGGGFTTSILGEGGYPELKFAGGYYAPADGAELYECTPEGNEILRAIFKNNKWTTHEGTITKSIAAECYRGWVEYQGHRLYQRGITDEGAHLFTSDIATAQQLGMEQYERGEYRLIVSEEAAIPVE